MIWVFDFVEKVGGFLGVLRMLSMTCHNLEFGRIGLDLLPCGCSSNASVHRFLVNNWTKGGFRRVKNGYGARRDIARCRVLSTKTPESFVKGTLFLFASLAWFAASMCVFVCVWREYTQV